MTPNGDTKDATPSVFYDECLEAGVLQAFLPGVGTLLVFERPDLHAEILVFVRRLHVRGEMFFLQAARQGLRVVLPRESRNLQNDRAMGNKRPIRGVSLTGSARCNNRRRRRISGIYLSGLRRSGRRLWNWLQMWRNLCGLVLVVKIPGGIGCIGSSRVGVGGILHWSYSFLRSNIRFGAEHRLENSHAIIRGSHLGVILVAGHHANQREEHAR